MPHGPIVPNGPNGPLGATRAGPHPGLLVFLASLAACGGAEGAPVAGSPGPPVLRIQVSDQLTARVVRQLAGPGAAVLEAPASPSADVALAWLQDGRLWVGRTKDLPDDAEQALAGSEWLDPVAARGALGVLAQLLPPLLGDDAEGARQRTGRLAHRLARVEAYGLVRVATLPPARRLMVVHGGDLSRFAARFRLDHVRWDPDGDADALADRMVAAGVDCVFQLEGADPEGLRPLAAALEARNQSLQAPVPLRSNLQGVTGPWSGSVAGMLDHNITAVVGALGGHVPAGGLAMRDAALSTAAKGNR